MTRALLLTAALTSFAAIPAFAQPAPDDVDTRNPPAPAPAQDDQDVPQPPIDAPADVPVWAGTFTDWSIKVDLRPTQGGFDGVVEVAGTPYQASGEVKAEAGDEVSLVGRYGGGGRELDFTARMEGPDLMLFTHSGVTHRLPRAGADGSSPQGGTAGELNVRVGQTWVYRMEGGAESHWIVRSVGAEEVTYDTQAYSDEGDGLQPEGEPLPAALPFVALSPEREMPRERVDVSGVSIECVVYESGDTTSWIAVSGDRTTFPGCVRSVKGGTVIMELIRIEEP